MWLRAMLRALRGTLLGTIAGIGLTLALLASIAAFISTSSASLTRNAIAAVPVDWQVQRNPGSDPAMILAAIGRASPYRALERVWYAKVAGFQAATGGTVQTTGPGQVVGLQNGYRHAFPSEISHLMGARSGVLIFSQTAANLHVRPGDMVTIKRTGLQPVRVRVDGIISMPHIDSFFQAVGLPPGAAPQAPPDNVLVLPEARWHALFDRQRTVRPDSVREQFHVTIAHAALPADPLAAYTEVTGKAHNVEARIAGSGVVGDNLAASLLGAQADALYARVLFVFLGFPGAALALLLTFAIASSASARRNHEAALLRLRGAANAQIVGLSAVEALVIGVGGAVLGVALSAALARTFASGPTVWGVAVLGVFIAFAVIVVPAWLRSRQTTVAAARMEIGHPQPALWQRAWLDLLLIGISLLVLWRTAAGGYQIVLAPEGVPQTSVHYTAFLAPALLWIGAALLSMRVTRWLLSGGRGVVAFMMQGVARELRFVVAAYLSRQHALLARSVLLVVLAFSFGVSTAVFNATYNAQSRVDAQLTNGSDVTVFGTANAPASSLLPKLRAIPGVAAAAAMQHRLAYVGNDLQDLYGIDPATIGSATPMSDAFFGNGNAAKTLSALTAHPDGVLVSEETVQAYQLRLGDPVVFRLQNARTHRYEPVHFRFVGVTREFPTAPKDSFLVANAAYVARATGASGAEDVLLRVRSERAIAPVQKQAKIIAAGLAGARVTTIDEAKRSIGSSLTSIDLRGLTSIELAFAVISIATATGLLLALGFAERRKLFAILTAIGADSRQLRAFLWGEAGFVVIVGGAVGVALGFAIAQMLVKILTGVFDPPPQFLTVPWTYVIGLAAAALVSTVIAVLPAAAAARRSVLAALRA